MLVILGIAFLAGCQSLHGETMVLLEEKIAAVNISKSNGFDDMNVDILQSFTDDESIRTFKNAITTAQKQMGKVDVSEPEYDVMVEYENELPTHGIHLWLGKESEKSMFMYIGDDEVYLTSPKTTGKLRALIISGE
ncbi:hypothetical protein [Lederbergia citrea]|uniref:YhfM-like domain-containing protein n=2 Tax=Lederbergia citrea TaxID=2833581 RepID=A0A942Z579_9BACI|nr:hypothetical protein [Lederbergia citrea]MBS4179424.1 hypothetical protein [Lederbergia citrea]MBS4206092.1 hypothetical protein [Lederbergia citrea]MBS4224459.1 hypothetical protein [Lederbergia citrea]